VQNGKDDVQRAGGESVVGGKQASRFRLKRNRTASGVEAYPPGVILIEKETGRVVKMPAAALVNPDKDRLEQVAVNRLVDVFAD
jgi:hypothetical protein